MGKRGAQAWEPPDSIRRDKEGKEKVIKGWDEFNQLCAHQCTLEELSAYYNVSTNTIKRTVKRVHGVKFGLYFKQKRKTGFISLRRVMWQLALSGDKTMIIWLSKQHLNFSEKMTMKEPKKKEETPAPQNSVSSQLLERLLSELKTKETSDKEARLLATAERLGIEK